MFQESYNVLVFTISVKTNRIPYNKADYKGKYIELLYILYFVRKGKLESKRRIYIRLLKLKKNRIPMTHSDGG